MLFQPTEPLVLGAGGFPFKYKGGKQTLLLMHPLGDLTSFRILADCSLSAVQTGELRPPAGVGGD